jgi:hypothetical protein
MVALGLLAVGLVMGARPPHSPPLYDGLGFPDEPYRWFQAPAGANQTPPCTPATTRVALNADGTTREARGFSEEEGPQVAFAIAERALIVPASSHIATVHAVAVANPAAPPPDGQLVSNVYQFTATADSGGPVTIIPGNRILVNLRADKATRDPVVFETWSKNGWQQIATELVGTDVYAAELDALGQGALVRLERGAKITATLAASPADAVRDTRAGAKPPAPPLAQPTGFSGTFWLPIGVTALLAAAGLLLARRRAARQDASTADQPPLDEPSA